MKVVFGVAAAAGIAVVGYRVFAGPSSEDEVLALLNPTMGEAAEVFLDGCDLQLMPAPYSVSRNAVAFNQGSIFRGSGYHGGPGRS